MEDPRPDSGHLQVCHPAPVTGLFEPAVKLGQGVEAGALLGTVTDATAAHDVRSQQTGIVLVLRTFSRVIEGESVGVVLETGDSPGAQQSSARPAQ